MDATISPPGPRLAAPSGGTKMAGVLAATVVLSLFLGLAIPYLPWWLVIGLVIAPVVLVGGAAWPLPVLLFALALIFELVPGRFVPKLGSFRLHELIVMYLAFVVALRAAWSRESLLLPMGPFRWPMLYLLLCVLASAVYGRMVVRNEFLLTELRGFVIWLVLPILCFSVRTEGQRRGLIAFCLLTGVVVAAYAVAQSVLDVRLLANRMEWLDITNVDVTRSIAGGATYLMVFTLFWVVNKVAARAPYWWLMPLLALVAGAGLAVSFGRGVWLAAAAGFLVSSFMNRGVRGMLVSALVGGFAVALVLASLAVVKPRLAEAVVERAVGTGAELESGGSFRWRLTEISHAWAAIEQRPLTGVGIGGDYKQRITAVGGFQNETRYIHNAYVGYMVKMGVQALLFQVAFVALFFVLAWRARRTVPEADRPALAALVGAFSVPVVTSFTQPEWFTNDGVAVFCVFAALLLKYRQAGSPPPGARR